MSKRQLNLLSFFKKKEELHDSKRVRKAGDEGSCSGHVEGKNRLQQEASAASRVHPQLAKPGQEAGTVAAAGQVHRQPEQEPATALAVSQVDHQQPEQQAGTLASASPVQQPEQEAGTAAMTSAGSQEEDSEGEGSALSGEGTSGMGCTVWTATQFKVKQSYYPWLLMKNTGFGCTTCKAVGTLGAEKTGGMKLAKDWVSCTVTSSAPDIKKQQRAIRKKVFEHARTKAHLAAASILEKAKVYTLGQSIINSQSEQIATTARVFRTAYKEAKRHRPAYGIEHEIDCQELNGLDMGRILHSNVACVNIQKHISQEMKRKLFEKIVQCTPKLSLMLDESTSLSKKSCLIIYLRAQLPDMDKPTNIFTELVELDDLTAHGIVHKLLSALERLHLTQDFLSKTLIGVTCDGASVMLGRKSGVASRLQAIFPNITVWHCSAHKLELAVADVVKEMGAINHFKILMDKLYAVYSTSNKNRMELRESAESLDVRLCKIGRILDTRWVASSFRTVEAVWKNYPALYKHFKTASEDPSRDSVTKQTYSGLAMRISSHAFVNNLGIMCDALQELSELSVELQKRDITIISAHKTICREIRVLEAMSDRPGRYTELSLRGIGENSHGITLNGGKSSDKTLNPKQFFLTVAKNLEDRMLSQGGRMPDKTVYNKFIEELKVLYAQYWPEDAGALYGETEVESLCQRFNIDNPRAVIRAYRKYRDSDGKDTPDELMELLVAVNSIPIASAECERGFSQMNLTCTANRASLLTSTISSLLFLNLVGPPLAKFNPVPYVRSWVAKGHRTATDTRSKARKKEEEENPDMLVMWGVLDN
jgi:hypothetical protein